MLNRSATANDSKVNRNVIANARTGIPIQRGPPELVLPMLLSYTIGPEHQVYNSGHGGAMNLTGRRTFLGCAAGAAALALTSRMSAYGRTRSFKISAALSGADLPDRRSEE